MPTHCTIDGCQQKHHAKGWCRTHYNRNRRHGTPLSPVSNYIPPTTNRTCDQPGCNRKHHAKGLCMRHYEASRRRRTAGQYETPAPFHGIYRDKCERCNAPPMGRGRWCLTHFQAYVAEQDAIEPSRAARREPIRCGTQRGRERHRRRGEPPCGKCKADAFEWIERMTRAS